MSVHSTTTDEQVEVRSAALTGDVIIRVWNEAPGGPLGETDHVILADLRLTPKQALNLAVALIQTTTMVD